MRVLEFYSGIGGVSAAIEPWHWSSVAIDQSPVALSAYRKNFSNNKAFEINLEDISSEFLAAQSADLWWMSPPCQPFTVKGLQGDINDPRTKSFLRLLEFLPLFRPKFFALENVLGFKDSKVHQKLRTALTGLEYHAREFEICPTQFGIPNQRPRFFILASLEKSILEKPSCENPIPSQNLMDYLDENPDPELFVSTDVIEKFKSGIHLLDPAKPERASICFASAYGRQMVRSGSFLKTAKGFRRFSPEEIMRLLHFPKSFVFPDGLRLEKRWQLAGNSVSVHSVRHVLSHLDLF